MARIRLSENRHSGGCLLPRQVTFSTKYMSLGSEIAPKAMQTFGISWDTDSRRLYLEPGGLDVKATQRGNRHGACMSIATASMLFRCSSLKPL